MAPALYSVHAREQPLSLSRASGTKLMATTMQAMATAILAMTCSPPWPSWPLWPSLPSPSSPSRPSSPSLPSLRSPFPWYLLIAHGAVAAQVQPLCDALLLVEMAALQLDWLRAQVGDLGPVDLV
eukprot:UN4153